MSHPQATPNFQATSHFPFDQSLRQDFFARATEKVAHDLLGAVLVRTLGDDVLAGRIVETEAYLHENDAASHSFRGQTLGNGAMFSDAGTLYLYTVYGLHLCANVVTEKAGRGAAVLLRAIEPIAGIEAMMRHRSIGKENLAAKKNVSELCNGPGKLAQALAFRKEENGSSLLAPNLFILPSSFLSANLGEIAVSTRVGITKDAHLPLRFYLSENRFVSKGKPSA